VKTGKRGCDLEANGSADGSSLWGSKTGTPTNPKCFDSSKKIAIGLVSGKQKEFEMKVAIVVAALVMVCNAAFGGDKPAGRSGANVIQTLNDYKHLDINTINCTINSDGVFADERQTGAAGMEWPKGSGKTCVFTAGIWIAGIHHPTGDIRTACMDYQSEFQPGPLLEQFNTTTNNDSLPNARASDSTWHLYKINKTDSLTPGANPDYLGWPGDAGAPYEDLDSNGHWSPGVDVPRFFGDQQLWSVVNDAKRTRHSIGTTNPMGIEVQSLYSANNATGVVGNTMMMRWRIINKSDAAYDSVYFSLWSDVDLGDANDDLMGCDTLLSLCYVYDSDNQDLTSHGYGTHPPAEGFVVLEGPKTPAGPSDSALFEGRWLPGYRNLPVTSAVVFSNGSFWPLIDPPSGSPTFPLIAYDFMKGKAGTTHQTLTSPTSGGPMHYWFSGNPVTGEGDLPANFPLGNFVGQDIRILCSTGPFNFAPGDTQEVVAAFVIGQATDRLSSVTLLKQYVSEIRNEFHGPGVTGVSVQSGSKPLRSGLSQNFPNPFNPSTTIVYQIAGGMRRGGDGETGGEKVRLSVYDLLGREVAVLVDGNQTPGEHRVTFDARSLASGIYFYRLVAGGQLLSRKLVLLK